MKVGAENEKLEFKKTTAELKEGVISMVSILNKHGCGELYFGIRNDGMVLGQMVSDKTLREISQAVSNRIEPKLYPKIELVYLDDKQCVRIEFGGDEMPYFAYGRAYIRVADEDKLMSPAELEDFILKKNAGRGSWDSSLSDKTVAYVDENVLKEYLERANQADRIDFTYTTKEDVLRRLDLIVDGKLKNAANALFVGWCLRFKWRYSPEPSALHSMTFKGKAVVSPIWLKPLNGIFAAISVGVWCLTVLCSAKRFPKFQWMPCARQL